jgi:DHA1 family multidrug resistance protein-like MFS transporter
MTRTLGASSVEIGTLYAIVNLFAGSTLLLGGVLADRYDPKKVMVVGWGLWVPVPLVFSFATTWPEMILGMVLWGFWLGGPSVAAYVVRAADRQKLTFAFAALSAGWSFGYVFSPAIGGYFAETFGMRIVFVLASILYASAGFILVFIAGQQPNNHSQMSPAQSYSFVQLLRKGEVLRHSVLFSLTMFALMIFRPFVSRFLADVYRYSEVRIGILGSTLFFGSSVLGILLGRLGDKWQRSYALSISLGLCSLSLVLLLSSGEFLFLMMALFLAGCSFTMWSLLNAIITSESPEFARARWISIPQALAMFTSTFAPLLGGILYDYSPTYPFILAIGTMLLLALSAAVGIFEKAKK